MKALLASVRAAGRQTLSEIEASALLAEYGLPMVPSRLARSLEELEAALREIASPWVMKIVSPEIQHKTEAGGVILDVRQADEARKAFSDLRMRAAAARPGARIDGVLVQHQVDDVVAEVLIGTSLDEQFGPVVLVGLGGIFAEALDDVALRVAPVSQEEATVMLRELRTFKILDGFRGRAPGDVEALAAAIVRLSRLASDLEEELAEVDLNPVMVLPVGRGVVAVDALVTLRDSR